MELAIAVAASATGARTQDDNIPIEDGWRSLAWKSGLAEMSLPHERCI